MTELASTNYALPHSSLDAMLRATPYAAYTYSYPHKTSYRPFAEPLPLDEVWAGEDTSALFLYLHVPFCEMRCGFCNLFTVAKPEDDYTTRYLRVVRRQAEIVRSALGSDATFARLAVGGGTPTQLPESGLEEMFAILEDVMGCDTAQVPVACEMSPETVTADKLRILREHGTNRASVGVQSFLHAETRAVRRPQDPETAHAALQLMRVAGFETINVDLIYGMPGQTAETFAFSVDEALLHEPEEVYLYPLYRRPLTGLGNSAKSWDDHRLELYRVGRDRLLERGWEQVSMRMFRRANAGGVAGPEYVCQRDGMVGLGAGARSYTDAVHYCTEYAVGRRGVMAILDDFVTRDESAHRFADYGFVLDEDERRRRHLILSLLSSDGLAEEQYRGRLGSDVWSDFPQLEELVERGLAARTAGTLTLTPAGMEMSDVIGPWLYSDAVTARMSEYDLQ